MFGHSKWQADAEKPFAENELNTLQVIITSENSECDEYPGIASDETCEYVTLNVQRPTEFFLLSRCCFGIIRAALRSPVSFQSSACFYVKRHWFCNDEQLNVTITFLCL